MTLSREYSWSLRRTPKGPLVPYIDAFMGLLSTQGYTPASVHLYTRLVADFSGWLKQKNIATEQITLEHTERYLRYRALHQRPRRGDGAALRRLVHLLQEEGVIALAMETGPATPVQRLLDDYTVYLRQERTLAPATLVYYLRYVRCFLTERFGSGRLRLSLLRAAEVVLFIRDQVGRLSPKVAKLVTTALRSFLQYARYRGYITTDLAAAVPTVANWSVASIPRSIEPDHVQRVLAHCNRQSAVGCRDYAILLLLARLGLRASEIAFLKLEDIDWDTGCVSVRGKGGSCAALPLPIEVGEAIATYLQTGRPASTSRFVFLRRLPFEASRARSLYCRSSGTRWRERGLIPHARVRISFAMRWLARCCGKAPPCPKLARSYAIAVRRRPQSTRRSIWCPYAAWLCLGREACNDHVADFGSRLSNNAARLGIQAA